MPISPGLPSIIHHPDGFALYISMKGRDTLYAWKDQANSMTIPDWSRLIAANPDHAPVDLICALWTRLEHQIQMEHGAKQ